MPFSAPSPLSAPSANLVAGHPVGPEVQHADFYLAYTPLGERFRQWKNYRGGTASRIWVLRLADLSHEETPKPSDGCVVTDGWLNQLIALAEMDPDVTTKHTKDTKGEKARGDRDGMGMGPVGPKSNHASPPQLVGNAPYSCLEELHAFAERWREEQRGQWFTASKLSGFCLLMTP